MFKTLKPHKNASKEQGLKDKQLICTQVCLALQSALAFPVVPDPPAPFKAKSNVFKACVIVMTAQMRDKLLKGREISPMSTQVQSKSNWDQYLSFFRKVLQDVSGSIKLADNESSHATLFLAFLIALQQGPDCPLAITAVLQYLDETVTGTFYAKDEGKVVCFACGRTMEKKNLCAKCQTVHYCGTNCQLCDYKSLQTGGLWFKPAHSKLCPLFASFKQLNKALTKIEGTSTMGELIRKLSVKERQKELGTNPKAAECLLQLDTLIIEFLKL